MHAVLQCVTGRENQYRHGMAIFAQPLGERQSVHGRQTDIDHGQIKRLCFGNL